MSMDKWTLIVWLNRWLSRYGLRLISEQYMLDLEQRSNELAILSAHLYTQKEVQ